MDGHLCTWDSYRCLQRIAQAVLKVVIGLERQLHTQGCRYLSRQLTTRLGAYVQTAGLFLAIFVFCFHALTLIHKGLLVTLQDSFL